MDAGSLCRFHLQAEHHGTLAVDTGLLARAEHSCAEASGLRVGRGAVNTRFLEAFVWVARLGSFRAAADRLNLTQAAISSRIANLEATFGKRLFERDVREVRLTAAGRLLLGYAERMLDLRREMRAALQAKSDLAGIVRIGAVEAVVHTWLVDLLTTLQNRHPRLEVELSVESTLRLHDQLRRGQLDVTLHCDPVVGETIQNRDAGSMPLAWIGAPDLDVSEPRPVASLAESALITMTRGSHPHLALLTACRKEGVHLRALHCIGSIDAIVRLVNAGLGIALVPRAAVERELATGIVRLVPCTEALRSLPLVISYSADPTSDSSQIVTDIAVDEARRYAERHGPDLAIPAPSGP